MEDEPPFWFPRLMKTSAAVPASVPRRGRASVSSVDPQALRTWLRLLTCHNQIEANLRNRLRLGFDTTLPRFDLMAREHEQWVTSLFAVLSAQELRQLWDLLGKLKQASGADK